MMRILKPEWVSGNIFIRPNELPLKGDFVEGHKHNFDHTTIVWRGKIHVKAKIVGGDKVEKNFEAGEHFLVRAGVEHEITALVDDTVFWCVYSHRNPQGEVTQNYTGWEKAIV